MPPGPSPAVLIINTGSTSTKLAVSCGGEIAAAETIHHPAADLERFPGVWDQFSYRLELCTAWFAAHARECSAVVALGGLLRPVQGGVYRANEAMLADARSNLQGEHASNLGCALAHAVAAGYRVPALVVDPVSVDEFEPLAYISGHPDIKRRSLSHALSIHAAARRAARELNLNLQNSAFVVGHLGGGISIAPVRGGRIIDANDAASDGPFSPERSGGLPLQAFITLCCSGARSEKELRTMVMGKGGLVAYLGTNSLPEVEERIVEGDRGAAEILDAMAYQIAKEIGAMATVLLGSVNAIVLTGGIARSSLLLSLIEERVRFIAPLIVYPGDDEMRSLAERASAALNGEEPIKEY